MKTLLSIACLALLIALFGEQERLNGVEAEKQQVVDLLMSTRTDLAQEVDSCDEYVAQHEILPTCKTGKMAWSEGLWACAPEHPNVFIDSKVESWRKQARK